jgi:hemolysin activation/secretion protein
MEKAMLDFQAKMADIQRKAEDDKNQIMLKMAALQEDSRQENEKSINDFNVEKAKLEQQVAESIRELEQAFVLKMIELRGEFGLKAQELGMETQLTLREQNLEAARAERDRATKASLESQKIDVDTRLRSPN